MFPAKRVNEEKLVRLLQKKTVLITGASYGIGRQLALDLAKTKCHLILTGRTRNKLEEVAQLVQEKGATVSIHSFDMRDSEQLSQFITQLQTSDLDLFINNAGKSINRSIFDSLDRFHDFKRTMAINYEAPVALSLKLIPLLKASGGQIINVSAINVLMAPAPGWAAYQASKGAFDQWLRAAAPELRNKGIGASTIYLPLVKTRMIAPTARYEHMPAMTPEHVSRIIRKYIISRKKFFKPWWTVFGEIGSVLFRKTWENRGLTKSHE